MQVTSPVVLHLDLPTVIAGVAAVGYWLLQAPDAVQQGRVPRRQPAAGRPRHHCRQAGLRPQDQR
jgi:hypothetical protein